MLKLCVHACFVWHYPLRQLIEPSTVFTVLSVGTFNAERTRRERVESGHLLLKCALVVFKYVECAAYVLCCGKESIDQLCQHAEGKWNNQCAHKELQTTNAHVTSRPVLHSFRLLVVTAPTRHRRHCRNPAMISHSHTWTGLLHFCRNWFALSEEAWYQGRTFFGIKVLMWPIMHRIYGCEGFSHSASCKAV